jgi:starch-binding outer membrane protein, SusD/RagB family
MKNIFKESLIIIISVSFFFAGCKMEYAPTDSITPEGLLNQADGLLLVANGNYALLKDNLSYNGTVDLNNSYLRQYFYMSEFAGDNVVYGQITTDPFEKSFTYLHDPSQSNAGYLWYVNYKIISACNVAIDLIESGQLSSPTASQAQAIGECYFMRAFCHFNLARFFAQPYTINPDADGIIIRNSATENTLKARATVKEVYNFVLDDLRKSATYMTDMSIRNSSGYPSKYASYALLSRVFLYMDQTDSVITYANKVINSGAYSVTSDYANYFRNALSSDETIWCIIQNSTDDKKKFGSIASMYYSDDSGSGWGEEFASTSLLDLMADNKEDMRFSYIDTVYNGSAIKLKNGIRMFYMTKFSFQDESPTLSSPVMLRISEVYLNRAEAYAKKSDATDALNDLDQIRTNRGLSAKLYNGTVPSGKTLLQTVLNERRIELAFEGHRNFDVYRNKENMDRSYWGYHLTDLKESDIDYSKSAPTNIIEYTNARIIYYIPEAEVTVNTLCTQNP